MPIDAMRLSNGAPLRIDNWTHGVISTDATPSTMAVTPTMYGAQWFDGPNEHQLTWECARVPDGRFITSVAQEVVIHHPEYANG
jgi:hypothetical protein